MREEGARMLTVGGVIDLLAERGGADYGGERVTQLAHALQAASLAEAAAAEPPLVAAALLHDVGHLLAKHRAGGDDRHEDIGAALLERVFGRAVAEPVRLHVGAKRWLCATDLGYFATLSAESVRSLELQGGPFDEREAAAFARLPFAAAATRLRRWDDFAKDPAAMPKPLAHFRPLLEGLAR
jgi:phosphonate degradation associated HDIG domain protein